ncbi:MAG: peptidylprolyl isomerase, partial [Singulisphaera sp.]
MFQGLGIRDAFQALGEGALTMGIFGSGGGSTHKNRRQRVRISRSLGQKAAPRSRNLACEPLEQRHLLSVTMNPITGPESGGAYSTPSGKDLYVPLIGADAGQTITYSATSSNPNVTATVLSGNPDLVLNVSGLDGNNQPFTGQLVFALFQNLAPQTVAAIINNVNAGDYNNSSFYRMETQASFQLIQGGIAREASPPFVATIPNEYNTQITYNSPGLLALAATAAHVASSEFFVTAPNTPLANEVQFLNYGYTIFGQLLTGQDTYNKILHAPTTNQTGINYANNPVTITSASIVNSDTQNAVLQLSEPVGFTGNSAITVTAHGSDNTSAQQAFNVNVVTPNAPVTLAPVNNLVTTPGQSVQFTVSATDIYSAQYGLVPTFSVGDKTIFDAAPYPAPAHVTVSIVPGANNTATVTQTPAAGFSGVLHLVMHADDVNAGLHDAQAFTLTVNGGISVQTPGAQQVAVGTTLAIPGISISDPGLPPTDVVTTTFSATHGTITLSTAVSGGITNSQITGNGTGSVTVAAPLGALNATLAAAGGLSYQPIGFYVGPDNISISATDPASNSAFGAIPLTVQSTLAISVPAGVKSIPAGNASPILGVTLSDPGLPQADLVTATFAASHGIVLFSTSVSGGLASAQIVGNGTSSVTVTAPLAAINATLAAADGLLYVPFVGVTGADDLQISATDQFS